MAATASHVCLDSAKRIALCAIASFLLCHAALCESPFNLTSIPNTPAFTGVSINNNGQVVGTIIVDPNSRETQGLLWSRTAGAQTITIGDSSSATGINDSGQVVGYTKSGGGLPQAFLWQAGAGAQMINVPGSDGGSYANAISNAGAVIGNTGYPDAGAFIWSASQGAQPLLSQYEDVYPYSINAASQVAGQYTPIPGNQYLAFFWSENNGVEDLGSFSYTSTGYGINDQGAVVGQTEVPCANRKKVGYHAFVWTQTAGMKDLADPSSCQFSEAFGINQGGWIVGVWGTLVVWSPSGQVTRAKGAPFSQMEFYGGAINDFGVVAVNTSKGLYVLSPTMLTTITSSPNPSVVGQPVTFTASVNSLVGPPPDGETVQFKMANIVVGTGTLINGVAQFTTSSLKAGNHTVGAYYGGDANYDPSVLNQAAHVKQVVD